jgi:hypothetical protein
MQIDIHAQVHGSMKSVVNVTLMHIYSLELQRRSTIKQSAFEI